MVLTFRKEREKELLHFRQKMYTRTDERGPGSDFVSKKPSIEKVKRRASLREIRVAFRWESQTLIENANTQ